MKQTPRTRRINENLKEIIASILVNNFADPRLEFITVTGVHIAPDLSVANVYVIAHGDSERYQEALEGLESAKGRIRALLGARTKMRVTPELRFFIDDSVDSGMRISEALKIVPPTLARNLEESSGTDAADDDPPSSG